MLGDTVAIEIAVLQKLHDKPDQYFEKIEVPTMHIARFVIALCVLCPFCATFAQEQLPSANDLKAAYCIPVVNSNISVGEKLLNQLKTLSSTNESQTSASESLQEQTELKRRLALYLTPRLARLDTDGIVIAMKRGEEDVAAISSGNAATRHWECTGACAKNAKNESDQRNCISGCSLASPLMVRIQSCNKLDWLP